MAATSQERLQQLEREAALARASLERTIAEIRQRLEADRLKQDAERIGQQLMERARERGAQMLQERRAQLRDKVVTAAMNNPAPVLALGPLVGWSLWRRLREIPPPILLVAAGGIAGLMRWNDGSAEGERPLAYGRHERIRLEPPLAGSRWDTATEAGPREQHGDMAA